MEVHLGGGGEGRGGERRGGKGRGAEGREGEGEGGEGEGGEGEGGEGRGGEGEGGEGEGGRKRRMGSIGSCHTNRLNTAELGPVKFTCCPGMVGGCTVGGRAWYIT